MQENSHLFYKPLFMVSFMGVPFRCLNIVTRYTRVHTCSGYDLLSHTDLVVKEQIFAR